MAEVRAGGSQKEVAAKYRISRGTLQNHLAGRHNGKFGHPTVLTTSEEELIVKNIERMSSWGFPVDALGMGRITSINKTILY